MLTSSNIDKILGTTARRNSLIYEKCKPICFIESDYVNTETSLHWGNKYEPVSIMIYEEMYSTKIDHLGCMTHSTIKYLGASPDGINIDETNSRYGRLIEVKNIVNREITGIPSETYWVQMQIQMEVCNMNECDFFETRIKEYTTKDEFLFADDSIKKGILLYFVSKKEIGSKPFYVYMPLHILPIESDVWIHEKIQELSCDYALYTILYWYLHEYSCIYVERNTTWFRALLPKIKEIWNVIEYERIHGYLHRMPKQREKKEKHVLMLPDEDRNF